MRDRCAYYAGLLGILALVLAAVMFVGGGGKAVYAEHDALATHTAVAYPKVPAEIDHNREGIYIHANRLFSSSVVAMGDLDGDGVTDLAVGEPQDNGGSG